MSKICKHTVKVIDKSQQYIYALADAHLLPW